MSIFTTAAVEAEDAAWDALELAGRDFNTTYADRLFDQAVTAEANASALAAVEGGARFSALWAETSERFLDAAIKAEAAA